jgi:hypothetical protein
MTAQAKKILAVAGIVLAIIVSALIVYANHQRVQYQQATGASAILTEQYKAEKTKAETQILALNEQIKSLAAAKDAAMQSASASQSEAAALAKALAKAQGETAALPPDTLAGRIGTYIGAGNIAVTGGGRFSFTRPGAEATYNLFLSADSLTQQLDASQSAYASVTSALAASESTAQAWARKYQLRTGEYQAALSAWAADQDALAHLRRSILGRRTKSFVSGAVAGIAAVLIFQLATQGR